MKQWPGGLFDHCITDPPFNISKKRGLGWSFSSHVTMQEPWDQFSKDDYLRFSYEWITQVHRLVKPNGNIFIFGSYHNIYQIGFIIQELNLRIINSITWFKPNAQPNITCRTLTESTEHIIWACNNTPNKARGWVFNYQMAKELNNGRQLRNVWEIPYTPRSEKRFGNHPSQKPLALLERLVLIGTNGNELILDCFSGTGTLALAAEKHGRNWVLIEGNEEYNHIARERIAAARGTHAKTE